MPENVSPIEIYFEFLDTVRDFPDEPNAYRVGAAVHPVYCEYGSVLEYWMCTFGYSGGGVQMDYEVHARAELDGDGNPVSWKVKRGQAGEWQYLYEDVQTEGSVSKTELFEMADDRDAAVLGALYDALSQYHEGDDETGDYVPKTSLVDQLKTHRERETLVFATDKWDTDTFLGLPSYLMQCFDYATFWGEEAWCEYWL